jgi:elongation of very long chain fatty acids protein 4
MRIFPGGDVYFGALFNSFIHVMMYSYYTLSLLKISCPWKKYLTQAQLLQFVTVVIYSIASLSLMKEGTTTLQRVGYGVQLFEMTSLFVLFMAFYRKTYSKKKKEAPNGEEDSSPESDTISESSPEQGSLSSQEGADES